ncbi:MAG: M36 family metallopeptidase [Pyrinomonadaceae bacterium]
MNQSALTEARWSILLTFLVLGMVAAVAILPSHFRSGAVSNQQNIGLSPRTVSHDNSLPNYDIRTDKKAFQKVSQLRGTLNRDASMAADDRDKFARGEEKLKQRVPALKVEYNSDMRIPELIAPDVKKGKAFLSEASAGKRSDTLKNFLKQNTELVGAADDQINDLKVHADYTNPDGKLSFVELNQEINGIPVFRGEVKAGFAKNGEIIRVINNLAPGLDYQSLSTDFRDPETALTAAASHIGHKFKNNESNRNNAVSTDLKTVFGDGDFNPTAEKMYFPVESGVAVPAWRVLIWGSVSSYYVIVDAQTGAMLWRKNITEDQTQAATYNVYANPNAMINVADSPFPMTPGPDTRSGVQGAGIPRTLITRIGNEAPYTFNNNGWITDGNNTTDGNNVQAGIDRDNVNGVDAANGVAAGSPARTFNFPFNPGIPTNPALGGGEAPVPAGEPVTSLPGDTTPGVCAEIPQPRVLTDYQRASVTQLFYISNWFHDETYRLGFTESARNFQQDNFGRGGVGNDRVSGEGQDCGGTNNANFSTPADGGRGRMQMYLWTSPTPDFDGNLDADVVIHELTHGLSNRLHGNGSGLALDIARGMGEGWSDFYAHALLSEPTDPIDGVYTIGAYDTYRPSGFNNYYYGIRRFPKAVMSFRGGPSSRSHNPLTFADIDSSQINISDGAFPPLGGGTADQVHNIGEVWSSALWEVRALMIQRLGAEVGNRRTLQFVTDGMKLAPLGPTLLTERDAIIAGALATGTAADVADIWEGFRIRGMGASASIQNVGGQSSGGLGTVRVTEAFNGPNLVQSPTFSFSDAGGDNDGFAEPGEPLVLSVPLMNTTGTQAANVSLQAVGGGGAAVSSIGHNGTANFQIAFTVPAQAGCGTVITVAFNVTSSLGPTSFTRQILIGAPADLTSAQNFDSVAAPAIPAGWTATPISGGINFVTTTTAPDSAPNSAYARNPATVGGGTDLTSPRVTVTSASAAVTFRNQFNTELAWDGGVLEISISEGPFQDILASGGSFTSNGYNGSLGGGANNPIAGRAAWTGNSGGYVTTTAQLPAAANGRIVQLRWRFGSDDNTVGTGADPGWNVDGISLTGASFIGSFACSVQPPTALKSRADFDGDGVSDLSVYRPNEGNWYLLRSTAGISITSWGLASDIVAPGDFDGDGKADFSVFRPSEGFWYIANSNGTFTAGQFGLPGDIPVPADYDGDGKDDRAVFRPSNSTWYILNSNGLNVRTQAFGLSGDRPVPGDYDGDLKADLSVFRPSNGTWYRANSGNGNFVEQQWGLNGDIPVNADYDGDNKQDFAVFRPSSATWYILNSRDASYNFRSFGLTGDVPVPGDYDGNGSDDIAVFRNGFWYIIRSAQVYTTTQFGLSGDTAIPSEYTP